MLGGGSARFLVPTLPQRRRANPGTIGTPDPVKGFFVMAEVTVISRRLYSWTLVRLLMTAALAGVLGSGTYSLGDEAHDDHDHAEAAHAGDAHHDADHHEGDHGHGGHGEHTIHGEAPKNYFGEKTEFLWWSPQLFIWTLLLFLPLWFLLHRLVWGPMIRAFEERDEKVRQNLAMARKLREDAQSITAGQDADTVRAQQEARNVLDQARAEAAQVVTEKINQARSEAAAEVDKARAEIASAQGSAMTQIEQSAGSIGQRIADNLLGSGGSR